ncbi:gamma-carotene 1'-hydroxylase CruF [Geitlerinema sp. PCC 9228]|uniref:gamma-carotene 1'-hydroxylase CruF n=1 Tax=Geitlerinema sp. PCC 9228 TaxID=111611 RepID=UPI0008F9865F|nr:carotenoid biosynthesis protein [Geitlerinema sp. PCC 9228]
MSKLARAERFSLVGHIFSMAFGLAGLLWVLPHPEIITALGSWGQTAFRWSMAGGGVVYILLGAVAVAIALYRRLGMKSLLAFFLPTVCLSLGSELLGTSTGFPFGEYEYLNGLGYKIGGLVPFTIPLSWFYLGGTAYLLARAGLENLSLPGWVRQGMAIALGAVLLTSWDFVLDPAMSQTLVPFWHWNQPGAFFGMPYQNFIGWLGTGALFMGVAALFWPGHSLGVTRAQLGVPLAVYLSNFAFSAVMSVAANLWIPVLLGVVFGVFPAILLWRMANPAAPTTAVAADQATAVSEGRTLNSVEIAAK